MCLWNWMCVRVFSGFSLGRWFDLLAVLEPFDLSIRVSHLHRQDDLLSLVNGVRRLQSSQERCGNIPHTNTQSQTEDQRLEFWLIFLSRTLANFGLHDLHLLESFQHATQVSDAVLKRNLLVLAGMSALQKLPNVDLQLRLRLLFPEKESDVINKSKWLLEMECGFNRQKEHLLFSSFEKSTEVQFTLVLPSISVQEYMLNSQNLIYVCVYIYSLISKKYFFFT